MSGDGGVAGEGRVFGIPKFHSWGKCTMPLTNINSDWMFNASSGLCISVGFLGSSTTTSVRFKCVPAPYAPSDATVIFPALKKPKKQVHAATHSIMLPGFRESDSHTLRSFVRMSGVIGRRG